MSWIYNIDTPLLANTGGTETDTFQEALFKAMLNGEWFTDSDGHVDSPTGYFGYVVNSREDWSSEFVSAFEDTINAYAPNGFDNPDQADIWIRNNFVGVWFASINDQGIIRISRIGGYTRTPGVPCLGIEVTPVVAAAQKRFRDSVRDYIDWSNESEGED